MLSLNNMRSDNQKMGGVSYKAENGQGKDWAVKSGSNDLTITLNDKYEGEKTISINAKTGDWALLKVKTSLLKISM